MFWSNCHKMKHFHVHNRLKLVIYNLPKTGPATKLIFTPRPANFYDIQLGIYRLWSVLVMTQCYVTSTSKKPRKKCRTTWWIILLQLHFAIIDHYLKTKRWTLNYFRQKIDYKTDISFKPIPPFIYSSSYEWRLELAKSLISLWFFVSWWHLDIYLQTSKRTEIRMLQFYSNKIKLGEDFFYVSKAKYPCIMVINDFFFRIHIIKYWDNLHLINLANEHGSSSQRFL